MPRIKMLKIQMPAALGGYVLKKGGTDSAGVMTYDFEPSNIESNLEDLIRQAMMKAK